MSYRVLKNRGFTLIETALALSLAAVLAASATPMFVDINQQAQLNSEQAIRGYVQTGIMIFQMESLATGRMPTNPPTLDGATPGIAASTNPLFFNVLNPAVTTGWNKESTFTYRSPLGSLYIYDPVSGSFSPEASITSAAAGEGLGKIAYQFGGIVFYDSGAIIDTQSKLAYVPNPSLNQVTLTLLSGTTINMQEDASASLLLPNGKTLKVADIHKPNFFQFSPDSQDSNKNDNAYLWVQGGQAGEGHNQTTYFTKDYKADNKGGMFSYEYNLNGDYSGGSLQKEYGFIYKTTYKTGTPQLSTGSWKQLPDGRIEGNTRYVYDYESESTYGYNHPASEYRYSFVQKGASTGQSETDYTYDPKKELYESHFNGSHQHAIDHDSSYGKNVFKDQYDYEGTARYDQKTEISDSETRYRYADGRDETYQYRYDGKNKTYEWTVRDNKTGKEKTTKAKLP